MTAVSQAAADEAAACVEITSKEAEHRAEVSAAMVRSAWLDPADGNDRFGRYCCDSLIRPVV